MIRNEEPSRKIKRVSRKFSFQTKFPKDQDSQPGEPPRSVRSLRGRRRRPTADHSSSPYLFLASEAGPNPFLTDAGATPWGCCSGGRSRPGGPCADAGSLRRRRRRIPPETTAAAKDGLGICAARMKRAAEEEEEEERMRGRGRREEKTTGRRRS